MCLNGLRCSQNAGKWQFESTKFLALLLSLTFFSRSVRLSPNNSSPTGCLLLRMAL